MFLGLAKLNPRCLLQFSQHHDPTLKASV